MNRDRLNELKGGNSNNVKFTNQTQQQNNYEMDIVNFDADNSGFMNQIRELEQRLNNGKSNVEKIKRLYAKSLVNVNQSEAKRNNQMLENLRSETSNIFNSVGNSIKEIDNETKRQGNNKNTPIRRAQVVKLSNDLKNILSSYTEAQREFREKYRERIRNQYRIVNSNATEEEIERALDNPDTNIFSQGLTMSSTQNAFREAKEKHNDMKKIEQSINELCSLFQDMNTLLMTQNETIVNIENNVCQTENDTKEASKVMTSAIEIRKRSRKTLWIITGIVVILIIILLIILAPYINAFKDLFGIGDGDSSSNNNNVVNNNNSTLTN